MARKPKPPIVRYMIKDMHDMNYLNRREQIIIKMRLGLGEYSRKHTLKEIGLILKLSPPLGENTRQLELKAIRKLHQNGNLIFL